LWNHMKPWSARLAKPCKASFHDALRSYMNHKTALWKYVKPAIYTIF
jgi:hypothetical protein